MNARPLVSAICVTYDRPAFVEQAVAWFQAQTWGRKEMIVVDDSPAARRPDLRRHPNVLHLTLDERADMGTKHNLGLRAAQGDVLCYQDDDDWFHPRRLVMQLEPLVLGRAAITGMLREYVAVLQTGRFYKFLPKSRRAPLKDWIGNGRATFRLPIHDGTAMFLRRALPAGVEHPPLPVGQKVEFLNALHVRGARCEAILNDGLFVYVRHGRNTWQYAEGRVMERVGVPSWFPREVLRFWQEVA